MGALDFGKILLYVCSVLWDLGVPQHAASVLYEDNNACTAMAMAQKPQHLAHAIWTSNTKLYVNGLKGTYST
jgi:hypothetical protein